MSQLEYETERQQVIGQIYGVNHEIVPEGAARWATWALEDRLNYEGFNPAIYAKNNRRGEDAVNSSAYFSTGKYPGYPYDKNYLNHDLHMMAVTAVNARGDNYDPRMNFEYRYSDMGIPGLTDGYNAVVKPITDEKVGLIHYADGKEYVDMFFRTKELGQFIDPNTLYISVNGCTPVQAKKGNTVGIDSDTAHKDAFIIRYASEFQGIFVLAVNDKSIVDSVLSAATNQMVEVKVSYNRRGEAGVPTYMDWNGICGSVFILFQK